MEKYHEYDVSSLTKKSASRQNRRHRSFQAVILLVVAALILAILLLSVYFLANSEQRIRRTWDNANVEDSSSSDTENANAIWQQDTSDPVDYSGLDEEILNVLSQWAETDSRADMILENWQSFPDKMLEAAVAYPETLDYVVGYLTWDGYQQPVIDLSDEVKNAEDGVPLLLQWDSRWGYAEYGDGLIGYTGCGPTCLAIVALALVPGNHTITPAVAAQYAMDAGYYVAGVGTDWSLMYEGCQHFGLEGWEISLSQSVMKNTLDSGNLIICSMGPGDFTNSGHFIVIAGYDETGFQIRDPNSKVNSRRSWSYDELYGQIKNLWAYRAA